jgi:hypothetical protein
MYGSQHWAVIRGLAADAELPGVRRSVWILSAGYGLIPATAPIHPYSATFSSGNPDSVARNNDAREGRLSCGTKWWSELNRFPGPDPDAPRSIGDLARRDRSATILIIASPNYVRAIEDDTIDAAASLENPDRLLLVSSNIPGWSSPLREHLISSNAPLRSVLGGALFSLHARVARWILHNVTPGTLTVAKARARLYHLRENAITHAPKVRRRLTDADVRAFIRAKLSNASLSCTAMLRLLRNSGRACEQARFKAMYSESVKSHAS